MGKFSDLETGVLLRDQPARHCDHPLCSRRAGYWIRVRGVGSYYCEAHSRIAWDRLWTTDYWLMQEAEDLLLAHSQNRDPDYTRDCGNL